MTETMRNASTAASQPSALPRAVLIGDSQMEGLAAHLRLALGALFHTVNASWQRGASTRATIESGKIEAALAQRPDVVVFALGGNDTANASYVSTLTEAVGRAARDGARVIWIGPAYSIDPHVEARHAAAREVQRAVLPTLGVLWIDSVPLTQSGHAQDGVHFTRAAYEAQARAIAEELTRRAQSYPIWPWVVGGVTFLGVGALLLAGALRAR